MKPLMKKRIQRMMPLLDERQKRLYLANKAISYGRGGISLVSRISGMSRTTITKAVDELNNDDTIDGRTRRSGGGRTFAESNYPDIEKNPHHHRRQNIRRSYAGAVLHNRKFKKNTIGNGRPGNFR
jgi:hypothetical protein